MRDSKGKLVDNKIQNVTVADRLVKEVMKNTLALSVKHLKLPFLCSSMKQQSKFRTIRNTYFVHEMMTGIKDELASLLKNNLELLRKLVKSGNYLKEKNPKNQKDGGADKEWPENETLWKDAPLMKSNSSTMVGR